MFLLRIPQPFDAIGEDRNGGVADRLAFHCPARITDHDLEERESLLLASDENLSGDFRNIDQDAGLSYQEVVGWGIVENSSRPGDRPFCLYAPAQQKSAVA